MQLHGSDSGTKWVIAKKLQALRKPRQPVAPDRVAPPQTFDEEVPCIVDVLFPCLFERLNPGGGC